MKGLSDNACVAGRPKSRLDDLGWTPEQYWVYKMAQQSET